MHFQPGKYETWRREKIATTEDMKIWADLDQYMVEQGMKVKQLKQ